MQTYNVRQQQAVNLLDVFYKPSGQLCDEKELKDKIKPLEQKERELILSAIKTSENQVSKFDDLIKDLLKIQNLNNDESVIYKIRIKIINAPKSKQSNCIVSFIKGMLNFFNLRIGSGRIVNALYLHPSTLHQSFW